MGEFTIPTVFVACSAGASGVLTPYQRVCVHVLVHVQPCMLPTSATQTPTVAPVTAWQHSGDCDQGKVRAGLSATAG